ncbi:MAG: hypothetical protein KF773_08615 [Deltaproteobacteria bacterium]|nr:hypothetical protein [Deltaproteobacteria bacterium]MCW5805696.1 hypothetical protein [Deltaproteobacteria bacterium]
MSNQLPVIAHADLVWITGGASRVTSRSGSSDQLTQMLTQVTSSIKDLAANKNGSSDMMMPMMMMMMMGGGGGGSAPPPPPAAPPPAPPTISISNRVRG